MTLLPAPARILPDPGVRGRPPPPRPHLGSHLAPSHTSETSRAPLAPSHLSSRLPPPPSTSPPASSHTCDLVPNQLAGLNVTNAAEEALELILGHVLGQVVDDEVGFAVISGSVCTKEWPIGQGRAGRAPCHLRLHGPEYLLETTGHTHSRPSPQETRGVRRGSEAMDHSRLTWA